MFNYILVAIGANQPAPGGRPALETCRWAVDQLSALPHLRLVACSRWYETAPVPASAQPDYVNGAVRLAGTVEPCALLAILQMIESRAGRVRSVPNAPRTLDLDLLGVDQAVVEQPGLVVPHPRLHTRGFVLAPLCDVAPDWIHPVLHRTTTALLADADLAGIRPFGA